MNTDKFFSLLGTIVILAGVSVVLASKNSVGLVDSFGRFFTGSIKAATLR